jgi:ribosomal protein S12 methylthiotransferase
LEAAGIHQPASDSPFTILTAAQSTGEQISRAASSVNQHSRPEGTGTQLRHEGSLEGLSTEGEGGFSPLSTDENGPGFSPGSTTTSRPEGDAREAAGRFSRAAWDGATAALPSYLYSDETPRILTTPRASAYIKIAEGCDHPCSFCIIPQLRGKFRSRPLASIVAEAKSLIAQGVREITLIGQDTTCYGEDLPTQRFPGGPFMAQSHRDMSGVEGANPPTTLRRPDLADLLEALAPLPGLKWLRFLYAYPNKITTRLLETIARHDTIAKYLDVPLQHASANVLKRMRRGGTSARFLQIMAKARATVPGLVLRTTFIVGFPGETEADFEELLAFVKAAKIDWLGAFPYSDEEGAGAFGAATETKVPKRTIEARRRKLMKLQQKISSPGAPSRSGSAERRSTSSSKAKATRPNSSGRAVRSITPQRSTARSSSTTSAPTRPSSPAPSTAPRSPRAHDYDVVARIIE